VVTVLLLPLSFNVSPSALEVPLVAVPPEWEPPAGSLLGARGAADVPPGAGAVPPPPGGGGASDATGPEGVEPLMEPPTGASVPKVDDELLVESEPASMPASAGSEGVSEGGSAPPPKGACVSRTLPGPRTGGSLDSSSEAGPPVLVPCPASPVPCRALAPSHSEGSLRLEG
jgi:hypothetical protein